MKQKISTVFFGLVVLLAICTTFAIAGEKESEGYSVPGATVEKNTEYSGTHQEYNQAVSEKQRAIETQGGSAMVNEAKQPVKQESIRTEVGVGVKGFEYHKSTETSPTTTSAAEEALHKSQDKAIK